MAIGLDLGKVTAAVSRHSGSITNAQLSDICSSAGTKGHVVSLKQKYIQRIKQGLKTVEIRFTVRRPPYFNMVGPEHILFFRGPDQNICMVSAVESVEYHQFSESGAAGLLEKLNSLILADEDYLKAKSDSKYAV